MALNTIIAGIVTSAFVVWAIYRIALGETPSLAMFAPLGLSTSAVTIFVLTFIHSIWKWKLLRGWLVDRPNLEGTWRCRLLSTYRDARGERVEKVVYAVIRQSFLNISLRLYTDAARSASISESLSKEGTALFQLAVVYQNVPNVEFRNGESDIHYGSALFTHIDHDAPRLEGHYWTDRDTSGSLILLERRREKVASFAAAEGLFAGYGVKPT